VLERVGGRDHEGSDVSRDDIERMYAEGRIERETYDMLQMFVDLRERHEAEQFAAMESSLAATPEPQAYPNPGDCHPTYTDNREWIVGWLDDLRSRQTSWSHLRMHVPNRNFTLLLASASIEEVCVSPKIETLTRRLCAGLAPYVGAPFHYEWWIAEDSLGRWIAGEARIVKDRT
jgi:hypothetical protein